SGAGQGGTWMRDLGQSRGGAAHVHEPQVGGGGRTVALFVVSSETPDHFIEFARQAAGIHQQGPARVYLGGAGPVYNTFIDDSETDLQRSEAYSAPLAIVLLLLVFGGVVAGALPVL